MSYIDILNDVGYNLKILNRFLISFLWLYLDMYDDALTELIIDSNVVIISVE